MGFITFVGKVLLITSILFQAFLLYHDKREGDQFNKNLNSAIGQCPCLGEYRQLLQQHLRLVVVGFLSSSALILFCRCWTVKVPTLLGLSVLFWIQHHGLSKQLTSLEGSLSLLDNVALWHSLGVIGAVIYLLGAECRPCHNQHVVVAEAETEVKVTEATQEKPKAAEKAESKGKNKRH